jgi:hypothetical protein
VGACVSKDLTSPPIWAVDQVLKLVTVLAARNSDHDLLSEERRPKWIEAILCSIVVVVKVDVARAIECHAQEHTIVATARPDSIALFNPHEQQVFERNNFATGYREALFPLLQPEPVNEV